MKKKIWLLIIFLILESYCAAYMVNYLNGSSTVSEHSSISYRASVILGDGLILNSLKSFKNSTEHLVENLTNSLHFLSKNELPKIESITVSPNYIVLGEPVEILIKVNEPLKEWELNFENLKEGSLKYIDQYLIYQYTPDYSFSGIGEFTGFIKDIKGNQSQINTTYNLTITNPYGEVETLIDDNSEPQEVHIGKENALACRIVLSTDKADKALEQISLVVSSNTSENLFTEVALYSGNNIISRVSNPTSTNINLTISPAFELNSPTEELLLKYSLKDDVQVNDEFSFLITEIDTVTISGNIPIKATPGLNTQKYSVVAKEQPILISSEIDNYIGKTSFDIDILYEEAIANQVDAYRYRVFDVDTATSYSWIRKEITNPIATANNRYHIIDTLTNTPVTHNHRYKIEMILEGVTDSKSVTSNEFLVDLTNPNKPSDIGYNNANTYTISNSTTTINTHMQISIHPVQTLDPQSGVSQFELYRKSNQQPFWNQISSGNVATVNQIDISQEVNNKYRYSFKYRVQNKAGNWSDYSEIKNISLSASTALIETLFNAPNPFDSRVRGTTIYYSLSESSDVEYKIYDIFGYKIIEGNLSSVADGNFDWDGTNEYGDKVAKGVYLLIFKVKGISGKQQTRKYKIAVIH